MEKTDANRALGPVKWVAGENRVTLLLDTNCKWSKGADRCSAILGEFRTQTEQAIPRAEQQEVIWRIPGANRASFLPISHRIHGIQLRTTLIVAAESMDFWLNFGIIWFENHGKRPGGGAAEFRGHGFPECQNRIAHASPSDENFCAGEAVFSPEGAVVQKRWARIPAQRDPLRASANGGFKVYIGESARWRKSRNKGFGTHPESFVHIRCIFTALLPVLNLKTILNVIAPRICAGQAVEKQQNCLFEKSSLPKELALPCKNYRPFVMGSTASRRMSMIATGFHRFRTAAAAETETQRKFPTGKAFID